MFLGLLWLSYMPEHALVPGILRTQGRVFSHGAVARHGCAPDTAGRTGAAAIVRELAAGGLPIGITVVVTFFLAH